MRCDDKSIDIQVDETVGLRPSEMISREKPIKETTPTEEKQPIIPLKSGKKIPMFKVVALGEYRVAVIGEFSPITEILRKLGGTSSDNLSYKGHLYGQAYSIMKYNIPRLLQLLDDDGWDISRIKDAY